MALASQHQFRERPPAKRSRRANLTGPRSEPDFIFPPAALEQWEIEQRPLANLTDADAALSSLPCNPLGESNVAPVPAARFWKSAVGPSLLLHIAVALLFVGFAVDGMQIAGGEQAQVALLGNAPDDQMAAGDGPDAPDPEATSVTLVTMLDAAAVQTTEAAIVPVEDAATNELVETVQPVVTDQALDLLPVEAEVATEAPSEIVQAEPSQAATTIVASERLAPTKPSTALPIETTAEPVSPVPAGPTPEVLVAERVNPVSDGNVVPVPAETLAPQVRDTVETPGAEPVQDTRATSPVAEAVKAEAEQVVKPVEDEPAAKAVDAVAAKPKKTQPKPEQVKPKPVKAKAAPAAKPKPAQPAGKAAEAPSKKAAAKAGSKGSNQADARRGDANGDASGKSAARSTGGKKTSAAGNAAVTNYPGKVASKLRRALRYPAQARSQSLRGDVQVSFTVSAGGSVGAIRVVRSSGSPILDKAALDTVRRAAPFPPIPDGAGRSSWPFTVPLSFTR